jgi:hypothetical protein
MKNIYFHNKTNTPVIIEYWIDEIWMENICCLEQRCKIDPGKKRIIHTCFGEWTIYSLEYNNNDDVFIQEKGFEIKKFIGNFQIEKKIFNIENDVFCLNYIETIEDNIVYCNIIFNNKKMKMD